MPGNGHTFLTKFFVDVQDPNSDVEPLLAAAQVAIRSAEPSINKLAKYIYWHLCQLLTAEENSTADRAILFSAKLVAQLGEGYVREQVQVPEDSEDAHFNALLEKLSLYLLPGLKAEQPLVRRRTFSVFEKFLFEMPSDAELSADLYENLSKWVLKVGIVDKQAAVRLSAVKAAWRLQDPSAQHPSCPIIKALAGIAKSDPASACRLAAIEQLLMTTSTGRAAVLSRLHDISPAVRLAVLKRLARGDINISMLSPNHLRNILTRVVCEPDSNNNKFAATSLLQAWQKELGKDFFDTILSQINVETCPDIGKVFLHFVFSSPLKPFDRIVNEDFNVPTFEAGTISQSPTCERIFRWAVMLDFAKNLLGNNSMVKLLTPKCLSADLYEFVEYVVNRHIVDLPSKATNDDDAVDQIVELHRSLFIARHVLSIVGFTLTSTDSNRRSIDLLVATLRRPDLNKNVVPHLTRAICNVLGRNVKAVLRVAAAVSDLLDQENDGQMEVKEHPSATDLLTDVKRSAELEEARREQEIRIAKLKVKIEEMKDELDGLVTEARYEEIGDLRKRIDQTKDELKAAQENRIADFATSSQRNLVQNEILCTQQLAEQRKDVVETKPELARRLLAMLEAGLEVCREALAISQLPPELRGIFEDFVLPSISQKDPEVRACALRVVAHYCYVDAELAQRLCQLFVVQLKHDVGLMGAVAEDSDEASPAAFAIRSLGDMVMRHGLEICSHFGEVLLQQFRQHFANQNADVAGDTSLLRALGEVSAELILSGCLFDEQHAREDKNEASDDNMEVKLVGWLLYVWFGAGLTEGSGLDPHLAMLKVTLSMAFRLLAAQSPKLFGDALIPTLILADETTIKAETIATFVALRICPSINRDLPEEVHAEAYLAQRRTGRAILTLAASSLLKASAASKKTKSKSRHADPDLSISNSILAAMTFVSRVLPSLAIGVKSNNDGLQDIATILGAAKVLADYSDEAVEAIGATTANAKRQRRNQVDGIVNSLSKLLPDSIEPVDEAVFEEQTERNPPRMSENNRRQDDDDDEEDDNDNELDHTATSTSKGDSQRGHRHRLLRPSIGSNSSRLVQADS